MTRVLLPLLALAALHPAVPGWAALPVGVALGLTLGNPWPARTRALTPRLLAWSVVGLGAGMNLAEVARAGLAGFGYTAAGIAAALAAGVLLGRALGVGRDTALLVSVGTAICGGSAIAAAAPVIRARDEATTVALATVFLLNACGLLLFPALGHAAGLTEHAFGLWAALAIHDTSSVVGAASAYGPAAELVATSTKLARALWIVPVTLGLAFVTARRTGERRAVRARRPWFILGFVVAAALATYVPGAGPAAAFVAAVARRALVLTLFLIGTGLSRETLRRVGVRPLVQGVVLWALVAGGTFAALRAGLVR